MTIPEAATRWLKFNAVGAIGIGVQLAALTVLEFGLHQDYLLATALAVEVAVIHNYVWHKRFTWGDRVGNSLGRFVKFNLTTGVCSIVGNILLMKLFVGRAGIHYLLANLGTIATCAAANFLVSDRFVFPREPAARTQAHRAR
jgi:putative flippase GtrA